MEVAAGTHQDTQVDAAGYRVALCKGNSVIPWPGLIFKGRPYFAVRQKARDGCFLCPERCKHVQTGWWRSIQSA